MELGLETTTVGIWTVLAVRGEVDVATAPRLRERLVELVGEGRTRVIVDLDGVEFLDSTGLGVLVGALKRVRDHGGDLRVVCTVPRILKVFEITGLAEVLGVRPTVADAVTEDR